ncbi:MAG TPA: rhomboid family intramembrane serine protease [Terracidiphilus sp.]|jgi:membrane associated rhomboid family serine protease|nr:rhomboid family intramembrane serine protease [Terracidiphilus sp.]
MGGLIPLGDASRRTLRKPVVTAVLIAVNVYVFLKELVYGDAFVAQWSAIPALITSGQHLITLLTSMFMHGGWMHIIGNMIFLWAFGPEIEDAMGRGRYLVFYLLGGLVAMLAQVLASPASTIPSLGASGAIAAVMGAFIITYPRDRIKAVLFFFIFWRITFIPASLLIGFWFLTQVIDVGSVAHVQRGGVAYLAHIGGFLFGVITARWFEDKRRLAWIESQGS